MEDLTVVGLVFFELFLPKIDRWPRAGEELFVPSIPVGLGGALNTASVAKALGAKVKLCAPRGAGLTDWAIDAATRALGIEVVPWPAAADAAISLVSSTPEDRAFVSAVDAHALDSPPPLPLSRYVHVGGLREARRAGAVLEEARRAGAKISVSACFDPREIERLRDGLPRPWDLLFLNEEEATRLAGSPEAALSALQRLAPNLVVTLGSAGAIGLLNGTRVQVSAEPVTVVDPTGAGDAFAAGTLVALGRGASPQAALTAGARAAERVLTIRGGVVGPDFQAPFG